MRLLRDWLSVAGIAIEGHYSPRAGEWHFALDARVYGPGPYDLDSRGEDIIGSGPAAGDALRDLCAKLKGKTVRTIPYLDNPMREFVVPELGLGATWQEGGML